MDCKLHCCLPWCSSHISWGERGVYTYAPPQHKCDSPWFWIRAVDACTVPAGACCVAYCLPDHAVYRASDLERLVLQHPPSTAPPEYSGMWLMRDNVMPESFITLDDAEWDASAIRKSTRYGWSRDPTCGGVLFHVCSQCDWASQYLDRPPGRFWKPSDGFLTVLRASDRLVDADGRAMAFRPGDMLRFFTADPHDATSPIHFMYYLQRLTQSDEQGYRSIPRAWAKVPSLYWPQIYYQRPKARLHQPPQHPAVMCRA